MERDPLLTTLLDLNLALPDLPLLIGGGYGLFLKQRYLIANPDIRTLLPRSSFPVARTTEDIDLILRADVVTDSNQMKLLRGALDKLGFEVVETAKYTQFVRHLPIGEVKIDFLAAPLGEFAANVPNDPRRVKPRPSVKLHASKMEEALSVDKGALTIPIAGKSSEGKTHTAEVHVPQSFSYLLMKFCAFRDRMADDQKDHGRHHALDLYRIVAMLTKDEDEAVRVLYQQHTEHSVVQDVRLLVKEQFLAQDGIGRFRIREHPLHSEDLDLNEFASQLGAIFGMGN